MTHSLTLLQPQADVSDFVSTVTSWCTTTGLKIIIAIVLLIVGFLVINGVGKKIAKKLEENQKFDKTLVRVLSSAAIIALKVLLVVCLIGYLGIETGGISAVIASLGVAVGFAINGTLGNLAGGVMLLIVRPFKLGDYIAAQGKEGTVDNIGICYTRILTVDNKTVYLPNSALSTGVIDNYSDQENRRVDLTFSVGGNDPAKVREVLLDVCSKNANVLTSPAPFARTVDYGAGNGVKVVLRAWCKSADYWTVYFDLLDQVQVAFDKCGIVVPFDQLDVHIKNN